MREHNYSIPQVGVTYTVRRYTRKEQATATLLYNRIVEDLPENYPVMVTDLRLYCAIVTHVEVAGLKTVSDENVSLPLVTASTAEHIKALESFMAVPPAITDRIKESLDDLNDLQGPYYTQPLERMTEQQKKGPLPGSDGKPPKES